MKVHSSEEHGVTILSLEGRLETNTAEIYDTAFEAAHANGATKYVLDCGSLTYISSIGLRSILQSLKRLSACDGDLAIAAPAPMIMEIFEISGFKSLLSIHPDRTAAVAALV
jgi:anti-anti-sigma factor